MPEANLFLLFTRRLNSLGVRYRVSGSEKHVRDIRSMLATSPDLVKLEELEPLIAQRGLSDEWRRVRETGA